MICPRCGTENPADARRCAHCAYKFRFAEGQRDPAGSLFFFGSSTRGKSAGQRIMRIAFAVILLLILMLVIFLSLRP